MTTNISASRETTYSEKEAASLLGISPSFLRVLRSQLKIGCYRFGGRVVYAQRHIETFKQQHEQVPEAA